jgi:ElaB/YqjD/DUF883 family membrane-anchored ribosome-binding protein
VSSTVLGDELRNIIDHAAALLDALSGEGDERLEALRARVFDSIGTARERLAEMDGDAERPTERAAAAFERWISENPWTAVAIGASVGLALGVLLSARLRPASRASRDASSAA